MSIRIDMVCGSYPPDVCGVSDYTRRLARSLEQLGADVTIITTAGRDAQADPDLKCECLAPNWTVSGARRLAADLARRSSDLVHIQFPTHPYHGHFGVHLLPLFVRRSGRPVITTLHEYCMAPAGGQFKQRLNVAFSDAIILTNQLDSRLLARATSRKIVKMIPIGSNIPGGGQKVRGEDVLRNAGAAEGLPTIVFFGMARPGKGIESLVDAVARLPYSASLVIVSPLPDEPYRQSLQTRFETIGDRSQLIWTDYLEREDVADVLAAATVAALPFDDGATERRGSLLAALANGAPVVTTRGPATPAAFINGENMLLVEPGNPDALADGLGQALADPTQRADLSRGASELAKRFTWDRIAQKHLELYELLVRKPRL